MSEVVRCRVCENNIQLGCDFWAHARSIQSGYRFDFQRIGEARASLILNGSLAPVMGVSEDGTRVRYATLTREVSNLRLFQELNVGGRDWSGEDETFQKLFSEEELSKILEKLGGQAPRRIEEAGVLINSRACNKNLEKKHPNLRRQAWQVDKLAGVLIVTRLEVGSRAVGIEVRLAPNLKK